MRKKSKKFLFNNLFLLLPQDDVLIDQILLKLPLKYLMNLRCVSKYFNNLISSPRFVYQHLHHSTSQLNNQLVLISSLNPTLTIYHDANNTIHLCAQFEVNNYSCNFMNNDPLCPDVVNMDCPFESATLGGYNDNGDRLYHYESAYIQASCNGLLYLHTKDMNYIWNPCTKEYKELLSPPYEYELLFSELLFSGFGYDCVNDQYKILYHGKYITDFMVCTLRTDSTWRSIGDDINKPYRKLRFGPWKRIGLFVSGALHWIMTTSSDSELYRDGKAHIISLDIEKEEFGEVQKPQSMLEEDEYLWDLQVLQGCLCICQVFSGGIDIWMFKDYAVKDSWTKLFRVAEPKLYSKNHFKLLRFCENGEIVMVRDRNSLVVYDPIEHKARHVEKLEGLENITAFYMVYIESLVSMNSGTYRG